MEKKAYSYIRFSTPEQLKGDSLRRQLDASRIYAKEHCLILDESLQDLGLSAYHGINRIKGALGRFLELVKAKKIEKGSYLIVENLDRLSREEVLEALTQFTNIIQADITIVTLQDGMIYSKESITNNWAQLIISITYMARAFDESKRKSQRLSASWINKRTLAINGERKLTGRCPAWLKLSDDKKKFIPIQEAVHVINLIFDMKLEGKGSDRIAKELNQTTLWKPSGRKDKVPSWRHSYIDKILYNNRALIGEFQPHVKVNTKRVTEGNPIPDYYPLIIPIEKYNRVQALIQQNRNTSGRGNGRNDKMSNLFGHLVKCDKCGYSMQYLNKGDPPKGGRYLQCDRARRMIDGGCISKVINYNLVEENILRYCIGLNVSDIIPSNKKTITELTELQNHLQSIDGEILDISNRLEHVYDSMEITSNVTVRNNLNHRASSFVLKQEKLQDEKKEVQNSINIILSSGKDTEEQLRNIQELIDKMKQLEGQERLNLRLALRNQLRRLIKQIKVDVKKNWIMLFFQSGEARLINLNTNEIRTRYRKSVKI